MSSTFEIQFDTMSYSAKLLRKTDLKFSLNFMKHTIIFGNCVPKLQAMLCEYIATASLDPVYTVPDPHGHDIILDSL